MRVLLFTFVCLCLRSVVSQESCRVFTGCDECISSTLACAWCDHRPFYLTPNGIRPLCDKPDALLAANCPLDKIMNPKSTPPVPEGNTPQLNPTKYSMRLRTQTVLNVSIKVTPQEDFPLDLYILMDISNSMSVFLQLAQNAAGELLETVTNLTSDSRLGFGTFVEKRISPFVNFGDSTHSADAFHNVQPLTTNLSQFQFNIDTVVISNNQDTPEGALDALIQSMLCRSGIEWRGKFDALRMILLMTDADFHFALDGKLAGIIADNDLQCRQRGEGTDQMYPSYSQVIRTILEENIVLIFSVDADVRDFYSQVSSLIYGGNRTNSAALLTSQLSGLLSLIRDSYWVSSTTVTPVLISQDTHISARLSLDSCKQIQAGSPLVCTNVSYNTSAEYVVEVSLDEHVCELPLDKRAQRVTYAFVGFGQVTIEVDPICSCDCSNGTDAGLPSPSCGNRGSLVCSVCSCDTGYQGAMCECESSETRGCVNPSSPDGEVCAGRGACSCGRCDCFSSRAGVQLYSGDFCECDNTRCPFLEGHPCGGAERGRCRCDGTCECSADYEHHRFNGIQRCECPKDGSVQARVACSAKSNDTNAPLCSGKGSCVCGSCVCDRGLGLSLESPLYEGPFCQVCTGCQTACSNLRPCVLCLLRGETQCRVCVEMACGGDIACRDRYIPPVIATDSLDNSTLSLDAAGRMCSYTVRECSWDVILPGNLTGMESGIQLFARLRLCPERVEWWYFLIGAIAVTVFLGVAALILIRMIWKYAEHRQYKKFEQEVRSVPFQMGKSPLYVSPDQEIQNPAYQRKTTKTTEQEPKYPNYQNKPVHL